MKVKGNVFFSEAVQVGLSQEMDANLKLNKDESKAQVIFERAVLKAGEEFEAYKKRVMKNIMGEMQLEEGKPYDPPIINAYNAAVNKLKDAYLEDEIELPEFSITYDHIVDHKQFTGKGRTGLSLIGVYRE
jgi:hypothetical protein